MRLTNRILIATLALGVSLAAQGQQVATPKLRVGIVPATDRFVTLTDGSRVYQGVEISYLLGQKIFGSSSYIPVMLSAPTTTTPVANNNSAVDRLNQIPKEWTTWTTAPTASTSSTAGDATEGGATFPVAVDLTITPVVETLIYTSGQKSDRVVFGFSPDHINPFNAGQPGSLDNQYIASAAQQQSCVLPDFFNGQLNAAGWGPWTGNFGANMDEGFSFDIAGFGITYKRIHYDVQSQIRFLVDDSRTGSHKEYVFQTQGSGNDVFIDGSYEGFNLGFEIQRTHTLLAALKAMVPQIVDSLITQGLGTTWENSIVAVGNTQTLGAGVNEGVNLGLKLISPFGDTYEVINVGGTTSTLEKIAGTTSPFVGEPLRVYTGQPILWQSPSSGTAARLVAVGTTAKTAARTMASVSSPTTSAVVAPLSSAPGVTGVNQKVFQSSVSIPTDTAVRAASQQQAIMPCFGKTTNWVSSTVDDLFVLYGLYRYDNVLDQAPHQNLALTSTAGTPKVALIDSGADYNDSSISSHFMGTSARQVLGFDFISWDVRPHDDNGHGTAAVKLLASLVKNNFIIVPAKVIGAYGETQSSAIYDAFTYAINNHVDAILVPWSSEAGTLEAYQMGAQNAAAAGIPVFVAPNTVAAGTNIYVPTKVLTKSYETSGLDGSSVQLGPDGVATVQLLAQWMTSQYLGGTK